MGPQHSHAMALPTDTANQSASTAMRAIHGAFPIEIDSPIGGFTVIGVTANRFCATMMMVKSIAVTMVESVAVKTLRTSDPIRVPLWVMNTPGIMASKVRKALLVCC